MITGGVIRVRLGGERGGRGFIVLRTAARAASLPSGNVDVSRGSKVTNENAEDVRGDSCSVCINFPLF